MVTWGSGILTTERCLLGCTCTCTCFSVRLCRTVTTDENSVRRGCAREARVRAAQLPPALLYLVRSLFFFSFFFFFFLLLFTRMHGWDPPAPRRSAGQITERHFSLSADEYLLMETLSHETCNLF